MNEAKATRHWQYFFLGGPQLKSAGPLLIFFRSSTVIASNQKSLSPMAMMAHGNGNDVPIAVSSSVFFFL
jgi:hypothetical protein